MKDKKKIEADVEQSEVSLIEQTDDYLMKVASEEAAQMRAARKVMREFAETLKMLADS